MAFLTFLKCRFSLVSSARRVLCKMDGKTEDQLQLVKKKQNKKLIVSTGITIYPPRQALECVLPRSSGSLQRRPEIRTKSARRTEPRQSRVDLSSYSAGAQLHVLLTRQSVYSRFLQSALCFCCCFVRQQSSKTVNLEPRGLVLTDAREEKKKNSAVIYKNDLVRRNVSDCECKSVF